MCHVKNLLCKMCLGLKTLVKSITYKFNPPFFLTFLSIDLCKYNNFHAMRDSKLAKLFFRYAVCVGTRVIGHYLTATDSGCEEFDERSWRLIKRAQSFQYFFLCLFNLLLAF